MTPYHTNYITKYSTVIEEFLSGLNSESIQTNGLVAPHIPMCGPQYGCNVPKVAIIGEETRGWESLDEFILSAKDDKTALIQNTGWVFENHKFTEWTNNFGKTFWDTTFKILANIHGEENWKELKNGNRTDILDSFVWCNSNSIEGYHISAKHNDADYASWELVKNSSINTLDKFNLIEEVFSPDITIIMNWDIPSDYLDVEWLYLENHLAVARTEHGSIIYRMAHPSWLNQQHEYDSVLDTMFKSIPIIKPIKMANKMLLGNPLPPSSLVL